MIKKKYIVIAASILMLGAISVKPAMAFLTATHSTEGTSTVHLGEYEYEIIPDEKYEGLQKRITIKNTGEMDVFGRVKVLAGSTHKVSAKDEDLVAQNWHYDASNGYYYYDKKLAVGELSTELIVTIDPNGDDIDSFNVVVVEEAAPVDVGGNPVWDGKLE